MPVQEKLLRVIEYGEFQRVGGSETLEVDVRVVGASNVDPLRWRDEANFARTFWTDCLTSSPSRR